ncbi:hypothetical protein [Herbaspirillum robiniae]|uniref:Branched-chain amino acid ATP-binding cassette transporter C-terminal domain-containing protein n=2 Tax=Herbaspirillum TaxID=963 RepID=A0ABX2M5X7_9BURK|nr:hypothetical protein [Herbaspirillum robiniae]NUU03249.1 hypothetical protein [Herbaspirillum robiniae]
MLNDPRVKAAYLGEG